MLESRCQSAPNMSAQNSAHVTKPELGSWWRIVLTAEPKGARIVARRRSESSKAQDCLGWRLCGDNTAVRMTILTALEWSVLPKAVREMDCRMLPFCLRSRDQG